MTPTEALRQEHEALVANLVYAVRNAGYTPDKYQAEEVERAKDELLTALSQEQPRQPASGSPEAVQPVAIDAIMEQAQTFASSWSLVGGRWDPGDQLAHANAMKEELRRMLVAAIPAAPAQGGQPGDGA